MDPFWSGVLMAAAIVAIVVGAVPLVLAIWLLMRKRGGSGW